MTDLTTDPSHSSKVAELAAKIKPVRFGMLTTTDPQGRLESQPMTNQDLDADGALWFFTSTMTDMWQNIGKNPNVNVSFAEPKDSLYVSISGIAERVVDPARIKSLWNPLITAWFPNGLDDPHLVLLKVVAHKVEYWDSNNSKSTSVVGMAQAILAGTTPEPEPGERGSITL